MLSMFF